MQTALRVGEQRFAPIQRIDADLPEHILIRQRLMRRLPCIIGFSETQTQRIVLLDHRQQGLLQSLRLKAHSRFQQQRLIPVLALGNVRIEEPVLNRRQARLADHQALLGSHLLGATGNGGERLHGLVLEQVARAEVNALLTRAADHLNRQNRVAAEFEEVSLRPTCLTLSTSHQICARVCSSSLLGAT